MRARQVNPIPSSAMATESADDLSSVVDCSVVVVTYNSARYISELLDSLPDATKGHSFRTIVVDNGSRDGTLELVRAESGVTCIETGANLGYAGGINVGRRNSGRCRAVLILNPDLRLEPGTIDRLFAALDTPGVGVAATRIEEMDRRLVPSQRRDPTLLRAMGDAVLGGSWPGRPTWLGEIVQEPGAYEVTTPVEWAAGAAMLVSAACDEAVGDWDEDFFMYSEEVDFALRARSAGYRMVYVPDAVVVHEGGGSGRNSELSALLALNRVRLYAKYHGRIATAVYRLAIAFHELSRLSAPRRYGARVVLGLTPPPRFPGAAPIVAVRW